MQVSSAVSSAVNAASNSQPQALQQGHTSAQLLNQDVSTAVLKKALNAQQQSAASLLESIPQPQYNNPVNLGNSVDTKA